MNDLRRKDLDNLPGKYIKQILLCIEENGSMTPSIRKAILDGLNDLGREMRLIIDGE